MNLSEVYELGVNLALEKVAVTDSAITAGTAFLSPLASGVTADEGKGLQTSLAGIAGNILGKKIFKNDLAARLMGSGAATVGSKVGAGLVSPDPEVIKGMKERGEFSKWDYGTRGLKTMGTGALIGGGLASGAGIPAAMLGAGAGAGRGAFSGFIVSPMIRQIMQNIKNQQNNPNTEDSKRILPQALNHPATKKIMAKAKKFDSPLLEGTAANVMPIAKRVAMDQVDDMITANQGNE